MGGKRKPIISLEDSLVMIPKYIEEEHREPYKTDDIFINTDDKRIITKPKKKMRRISVADIVLEGQERLSQKCNSINEKTKYMNLVVELLNYILFQRPLTKKLHDDEFSEENLQPESNHVGALIHYLKKYVEIKDPSASDFGVIGQDLKDDYEGKTIPEYIDELGFSDQLPRGSKRIAIGHLSKAIILERKRMTKEDFERTHKKVSLPDHSFMVIKYPNDELPIVEECIQRMYQLFSFECIA
eukprot:CAMPEP_0185022010 /NCGR_PEP_ID=MMETSP1103-20130426/4723_1 /TAXON_ID=36769 /ORGANISM="Paraphysomonas bandaiensis, Strain Caron Lab Isolate" /LENGTH=241 /DNA_ID=CAMNT_0027553863 /DNA_START=20 /DNA_END=741 /DNA_ORIENTATION=+